MQFDEAIGRLNTLADELREDMANNKVPADEAFHQVFALFMDDIRAESTRGITASAQMVAVLVAAALVDRARPPGYSELYDSVCSMRESDQWHADA